MIIEILRRITTGIAFGGIFTFIALSIMKFNNLEASVSEVWQHMLASLVVGIYFGLSSFIFEMNESSYLKKTIIHFSISIIFYFIVALTVGWIPVTPWAFIGSILVFMLIYSLFGTGYYLYYKKVEAALNNELQKKK
ncbi:DUF3021 domain-containing protein [Virgibacillus ainsalahensis]